jgi:hypothetical protein
MEIRSFHLKPASDHLRPTTTHLSLDLFGEAGTIFDPFRHQCVNADATKGSGELHQPSFAIID